MQLIITIIITIVLLLLKMQMITCDAVCHEQNVAGALYNVSKYATDALNALQCQK